MEPIGTKKAHTGVFITLEGGEGSGKSTQIARLARRLREHGIDVVQTREPGGSPNAEAIREYILGGHAESRGPRAEAMLFAAARMDHVESVIRPALEKGKWVICDRFMDSTRVYQGMHVDRRTIDLLEKIAIDGVSPDLTILLDVPAKIGMERATKRTRPGVEAGGKDRFERESLDIHEARRNAFLAHARENPDRMVIVDGARDAKLISNEIWRICEQRFPKISTSTLSPV